ncbi:hypothetical protein [Chroococcidiopsis sp.]|uniref:hypothetical protein n=1 Tax=Chroococcidiopsis sp. TaxID=3088168 RepID=UPI003F38ACE3
MAFAVVSRHYPLERRSCFNSPNRAGTIDSARLFAIKLSRYFAIITPIRRSRSFEITWNRFLTHLERG